MKRVLVYGLGKTGKAVVKLLKNRGYYVIAADDKKLNKLDIAADEFFFALDDFSIFAHKYIDFAVLAPGISPYKDISIFLKDNSIKIYSEVEIAYRLLDKQATIIAVTGTNGKTTIVKMLYEVLSANRKRVFAGANYGMPFSELVLQAEDGDLFILELSSFQLNYIENFKPDFAVISNITSDHLNWHKDFNEYIEAKLKLFKNNPEYALFNRDDKVLSENIVSKNRYITFSKLYKDSNIFFNKKENFIIFTYKDNIYRYDIKNLSLKQEHNIYNFMPVYAILKLLDVPDDLIISVMKNFKLAKHRINYAGKIRNLLIYEDSKATNPAATLAGVNSFFNEGKEVILVSGGSDKNMDYSLLYNLKGKVCCVILFGDNSDKLEKIFKEIDIPYYKVSSLKETIDKALTLAKDNSVLLYSPSGASFDNFLNADERGDIFLKLVKEYEVKEKV